MRTLLTLAVLLVTVAAIVPLPASGAEPTNPLLAEWKTPFGVPPFDQIKPEHYLPAFRAAIEQHAAEVEAIAARKQAPTFANTIEALEASGQLLERVNLLFNNLSSAETSPELQTIDREVSPMLASHNDDVALNEKLFRRVKRVWESRAKLRLAPDQAKLLENTWKGFVRGGALLTPEQKVRFRAINTELASLGVKFGDDVLKGTNAYRLVIDDPADLAGLSETVVSAAAAAAGRAGLEGKWLFTLHSMPGDRSFLEQAQNRELRRRYLLGYLERCSHGDSLDNRGLASRTAALRAQRARLLGYETHAHYVLDESMAKTPERVRGLLDQLWTPARAVAEREAADLQAAIQADGKDFTLEPWDWSYYTEKVRKARYDLDDRALRPYFELERVRQGAFDVATRLYGITFTPVTGVPVYHPTVKAYEVKDADGSHLALFYVDYGARPSKRGGAWSTEYRLARMKDGRMVRPIVANCCNFSLATPERPALLGLDEVETLFHEFGHSLHAILSQVRYASLGNTPRDFVEMPSQIMENWATEPEVLKSYARHYQTGETIPLELVEKIRQARKFNQGFATVEYLAASYLDMDWHTLADGKEQDPQAFERASMSRIGLPRTIEPRYRTPYFRHIFAGGYSAGYYAYIWAEVLSSDAFSAFEEKGLFDPATARSFRTNVLEKGASEDVATLYRRFRGREPSVEPLLEKRGLE
jgi:peptidyl-dipeptidase Dcp